MTTYTIETFRFWRWFLPRAAFAWAFAIVPMALWIWRGTDANILDTAGGAGLVIAFYKFEETMRELRDILAGFRAELEAEKSEQAE